MVGSLTLLAVIAAAFWVTVLGDFKVGGKSAAQQAGKETENIVMTPDCAWPYDIHHPDASAVCRMFYHLSPEQRAEVLQRRANRQ